MNKLQVKKRREKKYHGTFSMVKVAYQILRRKMGHLTNDIKITGRQFKKWNKIIYTEINPRKLNI